MIYMESHSTDPRFNLALEQYVFDEMPREESYFILWQNDNTIVIGKHQNTAEEINHKFVKEHDITVVRRLSGGGAVYHDMGNINFTFITDAGNLEELNLHAFCEPVVRTLKTVGIDAVSGGRNDILIDGKKFSGNAQYVKEGRIMHHGTLMFDSDLSVVAQALNVSEDKFVSKGFKSVHSRVTNIAPCMKVPMDMNGFKELLKKNMVAQNGLSEYQLTRDDLDRIHQIKAERYDTWEWNYGFSPEYQVKKNRRFEGCGQICLYMDVDGGKITALDCSGDFFGDGMTAELKSRLTGCELKESSLRQKLEGFPVEKSFANFSVDKLIGLLLE